MLHCLLSPAERPERLREHHTGTHVGARLENAPEVADVLLEGLRPEGPLAGRDALLQQLARLLEARGRLLGEQQIGVGAIGRDRERLMCWATRRAPCASNTLYIRSCAWSSASSEA